MRRAAQRVDWEQLSTRIIERDWRPMLLIDRAGRVLRSNAAFRFFCPAPGTIDGLRWVEEHSREELDQALRGLGHGPARVTVALASPRYAMHVVLELERLEPAGTAVLVAFAEALSHPAGLPLLPANSSLYEIALRTDGSRRLLRRAGAKTPAAAGDAPCWEQVFGRAEECPGCPVRAMGTGDRATAVLPRPDRAFGLTVVSAERRAKNLVSVSALDLDAQTYAEIVDRRIDHLARSAELSARERELLDQLLKGRSVEEAADHAQISARAVKYHQQNLLRKLGVKSRPELVRLLR